MEGFWGTSAGYNWIWAQKTPLMLKLWWGPFHISVLECLVHSQIVHSEYHTHPHALWNPIWCTGLNQSFKLPTFARANPKPPENKIKKKWFLFYCIAYCIHFRVLFFFCAVVHDTALAVQPHNNPQQQGVGMGTHGECFAHCAPHTHLAHYFWASVLVRRPKRILHKTSPKGRQKIVIPATKSSANPSLQRAQHNTKPANSSSTTHVVFIGLQKQFDPTIAWLNAFSTMVFCAFKKCVVFNSTKQTP